MRPFAIEKNVVLACHFTGIYDVNRNYTLPDDDFSLVQEWAESLAGLSVQGVLFHNHFSEATCARYQSPYLVFIQKEWHPAFTPNVFRYLVYHDFLLAHAQEIEQVFLTDVSDVVALQNPFIQPLYLDHPDAIFCGDEPKLLQNEWMLAHGEYLRGQIPDYADFEAAFAQATLLNCGIIGGNMQVMQPFIQELAQLHGRYNRNNPTAYTGDMGAFNYLLRTRYHDRVRHGFPVNTVFKGYESDRLDCWFRHK